MEANTTIMEPNATIMGANTTNVRANTTIMGANTTNVRANATFMEANATFMEANATFMEANATKIGYDEKVLRSVALLPWSHNLLLLSKGLDDDATLYYATKTVEKGLNRDLLLNAIKLKMYETQALTKVDNNFDRTLPTEQAQYANEVFGSSYNLGFLGVTSPIRRTQESFNCLIISG